MDSQGIVVIPIQTAGFYVVVDVEDADRVRSRKWFARRSGRNVYAEGSRGSSLHRFILNDPDYLVDHIDRNGLNCTKRNLRPANKSQNGQNRGRNRNNKSGYKGVSFEAYTGKWRVGIMCEGKYIRGKRYAEPADAAREYDRMALELHGEFAFLNFPNRSD